MKINIRLATLLLTFVLFLDVTATVSGINQHTDFWTQPLAAAKQEGNPLASAAIQAGPWVAALFLTAWVATIYLLYHLDNPFRYQVFYGIFFFHAIGFATWIFPTTLGAAFWKLANGDFQTMMLLATALGLVAAFLLQNKALNAALDKTVLAIPIKTRG